MTTLNPGDNREGELTAVAAEAFVFGYPLVLMDRAMRTTPANQFALEPEPASSDADTVSSAASLDLTAEPVVLSVPAMHGRYYVFSLADMWANVFGSIGARTTGTAGGEYAIAGPRWDGDAVPPGVRRITAPTNRVRIAGTTQAGGGQRGDSAEAALAACGLTPLRRWRRREPGATAHAKPGSLATVPTTEAVERMHPGEFFASLSRLLAAVPPRMQDRAINERIRRHGLLGPPSAVADGERTHALESGMRRGLVLVRQAAARADDQIGQWRVRYGRGPYGRDYLRRAACARASLGHSSAADELRASAVADAEGRAFSGRHRYLVRFPPDEAPPVRGFWSLTAYDDGDPDARGPVARASIGDQQGLVLDGDGSLPIHIQPDADPRERQLNWLPTPREEFSLVLRLFWPIADVLDRRWIPPAVLRTS